MGSIEQKVGDFYASGMDMATTNKLAYQSLKSTLAHIDAISNVPSLLKFVGVEVKSGNLSLIRFGIAPDKKIAGLILLMHIGQALTYLKGITILKLTLGRHIFNRHIKNICAVCFS